MPLLDIDTKSRAGAMHWWLTPTILATERGRDQDDHGLKSALGK
jgi:hypothetical protein